MVLGNTSPLALSANLAGALRLRGCCLQRLLLTPDEPLQITAEYELGLVRQIVECGDEVDHAVPIPSDVIEFLNLVHATLPLAFS